MALNERRAWLVAYDIANRRRLSRLHRLLKREATPLQYSVFCFVGTSMQVGNLVAAMTELIDPAADDVRVYQVPAHPRCDVLGRGMLPQGVLLPIAEDGATALLVPGTGRCYDVDREAVAAAICVDEA